jgi:Icc-related predicted phosphoesterase
MTHAKKTENVVRSELVDLLATVQAPKASFVYLETNCDVLFNGEHIGSKAIRRWSERHQPLLTLHGHIHESPAQSASFFDRVGSSVIINPGASGRRPHLVHIDLENPGQLEHSQYRRQSVG